MSFPNWLASRHLLRWWQWFCFRTSLLSLDPLGICLGCPPYSTSAGGHSVWKSGHTPRITWRHLSNVACQEEVASWNVYFADNGKHAPTVGMYEKGKGMCTADVWWLWPALTQSAATQNTIQVNVLHNQVWRNIPVVTFTAFPIFALLTEMSNCKMLSRSFLIASAATALRSIRPKMPRCPRSVQCTGSLEFWNAQLCRCFFCGYQLLRLLWNFLCCCWVSHWVTTTGGRPTSQPADLSGQPVLSPSVWWLFAGFRRTTLHLLKKTLEISWIEDESCDSLQWYSCFSWNDIVGLISMKT